MPELSIMVGLWCAVMSTFQGVGAYYGLMDRREKMRLASEGTPTPSRFNPLPVLILLLLGTFATIAFGTWMFVSKPLRPVTIEKTKDVIVEKPIPCPPSQTGPAIQHGNGGMAHSGNNDTYTITPQTSPPKHP